LGARVGQTILILLAIACLGGVALHVASNSDRPAHAPYLLMGAGTCLLLEGWLLLRRPSRDSSPLRLGLVWLAMLAGTALFIGGAIFLWLSSMGAYAV